MATRPFILAVASAAMASSAAPALAQQPAAPDVRPYLMPDRAAEIALARTAAPKWISDSATIMVLGRTGFVEAIHGTNGFTCLVVRSLSDPLTAPATKELAAIDRGRRRTDPVRSGRPPRIGRGGRGFCPLGAAPPYATSSPALAGSLILARIF